MTPIRFNPEKDLAPMPFDERICRLASDLKKHGLNWQPHVECFVWDRESLILNAKLERMRKIDKEIQPNLYRPTVDDILQLRDRPLGPGE